MQVDGFLRVIRFPPLIKLTDTIYNWITVENGIIHYSTWPLKILAYVYMIKMIRISKIFIITIYWILLHFLVGLQTMSLKHNIRDNIGLACFGRETKLLLPPFSDYDDIKTEIGNNIDL